MLVKCSCSIHKKMFAIDFQAKSERSFVAVNALPLSEKRAEKGYGAGALQGSLEIAPAYPGCPYCQNKTFFLCGGCHSLNCQGSALLKEDGKTYVSCANCGPVGYLSGVIEKLDGFSDL